MRLRLDPFSPHGVSVDNSTVTVAGGSSSTTSGVTSIAKSGSTPLTGAVTVSQGANVTITQVGQDISIAATGGGGGGTVDTVIAGNNIDVDSTDPANPIVSVETLTLADVSDVTATAAEVNVLDGITSTTAELNYTDGVTSAIQTQLDGKVDENAAITGATKTKITYDAKGLVTAGADATTADIADSLNKRYVTDANLVVIGNTSGTNTGDQTLPVKATGAEVDTGTNDTKFATPKAMEDSSYIKAAYADALVIDSIADADTTHAPSRNAVFDALALKQPLDSDLTTIAGLTATTDNVIQSVGSAWASRTPVQLKSTLALAKGDVGLGNVDNTSDANKPVSTATQAALDLKQDIPGAWSSWTPTLSGRFTNGDWTKTCKYTQIGKLVICSFTLVSADATPMAGGSADAFFTLPVAATALTATGNIQTMGTLNLYDVSGGLILLADFLKASTTLGLIRYRDDAAAGIQFASISSTAPFTWALSDEISGTFTYEAA